MEKVSAILNKKQQTQFNRIGPEWFIIDALSYMNVLNVECLAVTTDENSFLGILTEHEITRKAFFSGRSTLDTSVHEIMNTQFPFADINDTVDHCMQLMSNFSIRYLPVFDSRSFMGIISSDDILEEAVCNRSVIFDEEEDEEKEEEKSPA